MTKAYPFGTLDLFNPDFPMPKGIRPASALSLVPALPETMPDHDGNTYDSPIDKPRLNAQTMRVFHTMETGAWRTLREIAALTGDPEASISARLRDLRKEKFGQHNIERRRRGEGKRGLHEYRLKLPTSCIPAR